MQEIISTWNAYCGSGIYPVLFLVSLCYLLVTEKNKKIRIVLLESSAVITVLFFFPLFRKGMELLGEADTYYRILWLLPMTVVIAYAGVKIIGKHNRIGFAVLAVVLILGGKYVYDSPHITKAQNRFKIPNVVIALCNEMMPAEDEERPLAVFPAELIYFVRQYSSEIQMPYGREMLEESWTGWSWDTHPIYEIMQAPVIDVEALAPLMTQRDIQYLVLNRNIPTTGEFEKTDFVKIAEIEAYDLYRNEAVEIFKKVK